jgi:hypothetical protein
MPGRALSELGGRFDGSGAPALYSSIRHQKSRHVNGCIRHLGDKKRHWACRILAIFA